MFCEKCGKQNADGVQFCASCGAPLRTGVQYQPSQGYTLKRRRDIAKTSWIFMLINAGFGLLVMLLPLLPLTAKTARNVFSEKATLISIAYNMGSKGFQTSGTILLSVYICSMAAIAAGIVFAILRFKVSAFCILAGSLYPLIYSFCLVRTMLGVKDCPDRANSLCYFYFIACIAAIIFSAVSLSKYKTQD